MCIRDSTIAQRAFALQKGEVSEPIEGTFTTALVRVLDIVPGTEKPFEEVREEVRTLAVNQRVTQELSRLTNAFEDDHTAGMPILEAAKKHNLPVQDVAVDRQGRGLDGNPVTLDGATQALYTAVFASDIGVENEPVRLEAGAYAWFDVQEIIPSRQKAFEEVRDQAATAWTDEQVRTRLTGIAQDLQKRIEGGEVMAQVAESVAAAVSETKPLKRADVHPGLPISAVAQAFTLPGGGAGTTSTTDRLSRVVFQVTKVIEPAPLEPAVAEALRSQLGQSIATDNLSQYIAGVRSSLGTSINQREFSLIAGSGAVNN
jgi:peptidyl-prolyl cis-trans isomerase D